MVWLAVLIGVANSFALVAVILYLARTRLPAPSTPAVSASDEPRLPSFPALPEIDPLEGLRIGICVQQDHEHPTFVNILTEKLRGLDALIRLISEDEAGALAKDWASIQDPPDVLIKGRLTCNGYTDVFYDAGFECTGRQGRLTTIIERPSQGGRQFNLADTVIERLRLELAQRNSIDERRRALGELR